MSVEGTVYRVEQSMNDQRAMRLEAVDGRETIHAVEYATPRVRDRLAALSAGDTARLRVSRVGRRANVWRVDKTYPGTPTERERGTETERRTSPDNGDRILPPDAV